MLHRRGMLKAPGYHALRQGRVSLPHHVYLVTTVTADRRRWFEDLNHARAAAKLMVESRTWGDARVLCWSVMPDHWHGLVQLGAKDTLAVVMNRFKSLSTKALRRADSTKPVWARGFHDHALRSDETLVQAARYIVANPVRAGLVKNALDYPYWDAIWM